MHTNSLYNQLIDITCMWRVCKGKPLRTNSNSFSRRCYSSNIQRATEENSTSLFGWHSSHPGPTSSKSKCVKVTEWFFSPKTISLDQFVVSIRCPGSRWERTSQWKVSDWYTIVSKGIISTDRPFDKSSPQTNTCVIVYKKLTTQ